MGKYFQLIVVLVAFSGCSVAMALSGNEHPNFEAFDIGSTREQVEIQLGEPVDTQAIEGGKTRDTYEFEYGNQPNGYRALMNAYIDLVTLLLWELPGTIIEAMIGEDKETIVVYDKDEHVVKIDGFTLKEPDQAAKITE